MNPLEKMHTDASGVPGPTPDGPPWLNSIPVVAGILKEYAAESIRRVGEPGGLEWVLQRARQLNATFLGHGYADPIIYATGPWNTPEFVGNNCIRALRINGEDREGPMLALLAMVSELVDIVQAHEGEHPAEFGPRMDAVILRTRNALLGLPMGEEGA